MEFTIDKNDKTPIYRQLYQEILNKIKLGELPPGTMLPSERLLSKNLHVNRSTIIRTYDELFSVGLIEKKPGIGTFVSLHIWKDLLHTNWDHYVKNGMLLPTNKHILNVRKSSKLQQDHYDFSTNELGSELCPSKSLMQGLEEYSKDINMCHPEQKGLLELREQIVKHMEKYYNIKTSASSILITSGSQQALYLIVQSLLNAGDSIALESPSYAESQSFFKSANLKIYYLNINQKGIKTEEIEALYKMHRIKMIFLNPTYQNPTGISYPLKNRKEIAKVAERLGIPIIEGDPFSLLNLDGEMIMPIKSFDKTGNVIYLGSFSKILGSSMRLGWVIAPQSVIERLADSKYQMDFGSGIFPQIMVSEFLRKNKLDPHLDTVKAALINRRKSMIAALNHYFGNQFIYELPAGGLHLYGRFKQEENLYLAPITKHYSVASGTMYGAHSDYIRLSFSKLNEYDIIQGIRIMSSKLG